MMQAWNSRPMQMILTALFGCRQPVRYSVELIEHLCRPKRAAERILCTKHRKGSLKRCHLRTRDAILLAIVELM